MFIFGLIITTLMALGCFLMSAAVGFAGYWNGADEVKAAAIVLFIFGVLLAWFTIAHAPFTIIAI